MNSARVENWTGRVGVRHPTDPLAPRPSPTPARQTARRQGIRLPAPAGLPARARHRPAHRPPRDRIQPTSGTPPLGRRARDLLAHRLSPLTPPLRAPGRPFRFLRRHPRRPHLLPPTGQMRRRLSEITSHQRPNPPTLATQPSGAELPAHRVDFSREPARNRLGLVPVWGVTATMALQSLQRAEMGSQRGSATERGWVPDVTWRRSAIPGWRRCCRPIG